MNHEVEVLDGYYALCSCGWRSPMCSYFKAFDYKDQHEADAKNLRLNSGAKPSNASMVKMWREKANDLTYTATERSQWKMLADELEDRITTGAITDQMNLFD